MSASRFFAAMFAVMVWASNAAAQTIIRADDMTVSGRFALPHANQTVLLEHLWIDAVAVDPALLEPLDWAEADFESALQTASTRSLTNYGYAGQQNALSIQLSTVRFEETETGIAAHVRIDFASDAACAARSTEASFTALHWARRQMGVPIFAFVTVVLLTAANPYNPHNTTTASVFLQGQMSNHDMNQRTQNQGQGYAPARGDEAARRYALLSAVQLALAAYIAQIGGDAACAVSVSAPIAGATEAPVIAVSTSTADTVTEAAAVEAPPAIMP